MKEVLDAHYRRLARSYDDYLYYSPRFVRTLTSRMIQKLELEPEDVLVDLGCGTAMYTLDILAQVKLRRPVIGVDPFQEMLDRIPAGAPVDRRCLTALEFSKLDHAGYNKVLMKEAVHHVQDRPALFAHLFSRLPAGGRLLLVHVPPKVAYPLFEAALRRAERWHADPDALETQLQAAGFAVERDGLDYEHALPKEKYFAMVEGRYMSVLSSFGDEEIRAGLAEMEERYGHEPVLRFTDHFDYLSAVKG